MEKSYTLTPEQEAEVEKILARGKKKYALLEGIIWENPCPEGAMFESELE